MNSTFTPFAVRIADQYDDGEQARHYTLQALEPEQARAAAPGQFFMLSVPGHGEAPFTYVRSPDASGCFTALVRRTGSLTSALFDLGPGALLGVRGPFGRGWPAASLLQDPVLVIAGGCGLAPLSPALDALCQHSDKPRAALIYGSRSEASQVLAHERARWLTRLPVFETFDHPSQPEHTEGTPLLRLDAALAAIGGGVAHALVCGPEAMMLHTASALAQRGLPHEQIWLSLERRMHCGIGLCGHCYLAQTYVCQQGPTYRYDELLSLLAKSPERAAQVSDIHHC